MLKKILYFMLLLSCIIQVSKAQKVQSIELNFDRNDFSFTKNGNGTLSINSDKYICGYDSATAEPALPLIPINIRVPHGSSYKGVLETSTPNLVCNNVIVEKNPVMVPTNSNITIETSENTIHYASEAYPQTNLQLVEMSDFDGYSILRVLVCPFKYTTNDNNLYIIGSIKLAINVNDVSTLANDELQGGSNMNELVNSTSISPFGIENRTLASSTLTTIQDKSQLLNYVIITSSDLAKNFKPLAVWKKTKGLNAEVVTLDEIKDNYPEADMQLSIKSYLHDMYLNRGLKYALLGGDDTIVPVRMCYMKLTSNEAKNNIPTDLYYACFDRCFSWDGNSNGIYGETADNISLDPSIFVTRVPVRTSTDVRAFVNKVIGYEKEPLKKMWDNSMLTAGNYLFNKRVSDNPIQSDTEVKGNHLYENYIGKYWNGTRQSLYDTYSDFTGGADYDFNKEHFQEQLHKGYNFVDVISHGRPDAWGLENYDEYTVEYANVLENPTYTIITTNACETNAFDSYIYKDGKMYDPCMSEAFIRNKNSGVVAYLGSSRSGWAKLNTDLGPSLQYEAQFYKHLFSHIHSNKNFGMIVACAKQDMVGLCKCDGENRWLQFSLNPIGDPEMPIYTATPKVFDNVKFAYGAENSISVYTGVDSCTVCAMSTDDNGKTYYRVMENSSNVEFNNINTGITICVTKQNYKPFLSTYTPTAEKKNSINSCVIDKSSGYVTINVHIDSSAKDATLAITSLSTGRQITVPVLSQDYSAKIKMSSLQDGINIVSLSVNGKIVDTKRFNK